MREIETELARLRQELLDANLRIQELEQQASFAATYKTSDKISEIDLMEFFDQSPIGVLRSTMSGRIVAANPAMARIAGYDSPRDFLDSVKSALQLYYRESEREKLVQALQEARRWFELEIVIRRKDGEPIMAKIRARALDNVPDGIIDCFLEDITERKRAEEALLQEQARFKTLVDELPFGLALVDYQGMFLYINPAFIKMFGYRLEDLPTGESWFRQAFPDEQERVSAVQQWCYLRDRRHTGLLDSRSLTITCKDGSRKVITAKGVALQSGRFCIVCQDITRQVTTEENLRLNQARLHTLVHLSRMDESSIPELGEFALEEAVRLTRSQYGHLCFLNEDESRAVSRFWSGKVLQECSPDSIGTSFPDVDRGINAEAIRQRRAIIVNRPDEPGGQKRLPKGHLPISRYLSVPVFDGDKIVALVEVANKDTDYEEDDIQQITLLMTGMWRLIQRRQMEEALAQSEGRFRSIIQHSPYGILIYELPKRNCLFANPVAQRLFGYTPAEMAGLTVWDVIHPKDHPILKEKIRELQFKDGWLSESPTVYTGIRKDGSTFRFEVTAAQISFEGKNAIQGMIRDVTEREQLERQLQHAQKMEAVGTLANGVAHEFNNILMAIKGYTQLLHMVPNNPDMVLKQLAKIDDCTERAAALTGKMLTFSRLESGDKSPFNINIALENVIGLLRQTMPPNIELDMDAAPDVPLVMANKNQIEQVLLNLAVNARDAMPHGGRMVFRSRVRNLDHAFTMANPWSKAGRYAEISVRDTGLGISREIMERLFEPFFTTKEPGQGTGLGLAVAYSIIKNHNGYITAENIQGRGAVFRIFLPVQGDIRIPSEHIEPEETVGHGTSERVLVVDDEETVREVYISTLESFGYRPVAASNGGEALRLYRHALRNQDPFRLVILDYAMPVMDGGQCCGLLLEMDPAARILIATGHAEAALKNQDIRTKVVGILQKPFHLKDLAREVERGIKVRLPLSG